MMKKSAIAMLMILCLLLAGCSQKEPEEEAQIGYKPPEVVGSVTQTGEKETLVQQSGQTTVKKPAGLNLQDFTGKFPVKTADHTFTVLNLNLCNEDGVGDQSYASRYNALLEVLLQQNPDVITFQEVGSGWMDYIVPQLENIYEYYLIYPNAKDKTTANPIFYKSEKFREVYGGCFWISDTPDQESAAADGKYYNCTWLQLQEKATDKKVYFFNTQLSEAVSEKAASILAEKQEGLGWKEPVVCSLDLGAPLTGEAEKTLLKTFTNANSGSKTPTSHVSSEAIHDFSLYTKVTLKADSYKVITGKNVSDHNPMLVTYTINTDTLNYGDEFIF